MDLVFKRLGSRLLCGFLFFLCLVYFVFRGSGSRARAALEVS